MMGVAFVVVALIAAGVGYKLGVARATKSIGSGNPKPGGPDDPKPIDP